MSKVVLCVGCFELLHTGHLEHLEASYDMGSTLIVGVTRDGYVNKGKGRPVINASNRARIVQAIWCVDKVLLVRSSLEALKKAEPDIFSLGSDYRGKVREEDMRYCEIHGIEIRFTNRPRDSSTEIYDRIRASI